MSGEIILPAPLPPKEEPNTPTTEQIREEYAYDGGEAEYHDPINGARSQREFAFARFDAWFASVVAAARAEGAAAEREACAQVAEWGASSHDSPGTIAAAIRARSGDGDPLTAHDAEVAARAQEAFTGLAVAVVPDHSRSGPRRPGRVPGW